MSVNRKQTFDLSTVSAGTPEIISLGNEAFLKLVSAQINQVNVSLAGVVLKLVQSNDGVNWADILDEKDKEITETTTATTDIIFLATDFIKFNQFGISIDVAGATTGTLEIYYANRNALQ